MEKIKNIRKRLRHQRSVRRRKLGLSTPTQIICVSFIAVIALGTLLLTLPIASRHGRLDVLNAMFTATSATCVTGLVVRDTWTQFTWFGQAVVLLLIQVGGLGLVTLTSFFALAMRRRMGSPQSGFAAETQRVASTCAPTSTEISSARSDSSSVSTTASNRS